MGKTKTKTKSKTKSKAKAEPKVGSKTDRLVIDEGSIDPSLNMDVINFVLTGFGGVMLNAANLSAPQDAGPKVIPTSEEEAEAAAYRLDDGQMYIPALGCKGSLMAGAVNLRVGTKALTSRLSSSIFLPTIDGELVERIPLFDCYTGEPIKDYATDLRRVIIPKTRAGVMRARPVVTNWSAVVPFLVFREFWPREQDLQLLTDLFQRAGHLIGLFDGRPGKGKNPLSFGTYVVRRILPDEELGLQMCGKYRDEYVARRPNYGKALVVKSLKG